MTTAECQLDTINSGNLLRSIEISAKRFGCDAQLKQILINTAKLFDE